MRRFSVAFFVLAFTACATARSGGRPYVTLEHDSGTAWRATYHLRAPVRELRFQRNGSNFRSRAFEVITPGFSLQRDGDKDVIRTDGDPTDVIALRLKEYTDEIPKDYEVFEKFTDGSVAIYTGHLLVKAGGERVRDFRFVPRDGEKVVVGGKRSASAVDWSDTSGEGTYVYFGSIEPVETPDAISIIDPGLPPWLAQKSRDAMPRLFELYARKFGVRVPARPTVLFNYVRGDGTGLSDNGGTLPNLIQLQVEGRDWEHESEEGLLHLLHFLAHEAAHVWNGQIVHYPGTEHSWMHEGSADALAERALRELGVIDEQRFLEYQTAALNDCRHGLGNAPLREAAATRHFSLYYSCGNVIALLTDASVDADLFSFWRALIARAHATTGKTYDVGDYMAVWQELGATPNDVATLQSIVNDPPDAEKMVAALRGHGVRLAESDEVPQSFRRTLARDALLHLLRENCKTPYGFGSVSSGFRLDNPLNCPALPANGLVTTIGGHDVMRNGEGAWDSLHNACGAGGSIVVRVDDRDMTVPCTARVAARPPYVRILDVP